MNRAALVDGVKQGAGPGIAGFGLALSFGAEAAARHWETEQAVVFSMLTFSGSAQFTFLAGLGTGSALAAIVAAVLINTRYLVMSVVLNDSLSGGRLRRALQTQALVDASFVIAHRHDGRYDVNRLVGASLPQWLCWVGGTAVGALVAPPPDLLYTLGLDAVFPAFFLILALDEIRRSRRALIAAAAGTGIAAALLLVTSPTYALLGAIPAALIGLLPEEKP